MLLFTFIILSSIYATTLQEAYNLAQPYGDYEKYIILENNTIYEGGIGVFEGDVFIEGNGAIINLEDQGGVWVYSEPNYMASLDIDNCTIMNGLYYGVSYAGNATGEITNCNFINNGYGVQLYDTTEINIKNSNFVNNTIYGLAIVGTTAVCNVNYCNTWGNGESSWMENCIG
tara:strand:- start:257 stop:775 length:519 start_codon:yes stop_codon:yes gene_type:complete